MLKEAQCIQFGDQRKLNRENPFVLAFREIYVPRNLPIIRYSGLGTRLQQVITNKFINDLFQNGTSLGAKMTHLSAQLHNTKVTHLRGVRHLLKSCTRFRNQLDFQLISDFKLDFSDFQSPEINGDLAKTLV